MLPLLCIERRYGRAGDVPTMMIYCNTRIDCPKVLYDRGIVAMQYMWSKNTYYKNHLFPTHYARKYKYWCQITLPIETNTLASLDYVEDLLSVYCLVYRFAWINWLFSK